MRIDLDWRGRLPLLRGLLCTTALTVLSPVAWAQGAAQGEVTQLPNLSVSGQAPAAQGFVPLRGTAGSKTDTPPIEVPQSVSTVTREQIESQGAQTVSEALRYSAGVAVQPFGTDTRYDQIRLRGFDAHTLGDYRDGLRQPANNFAYFRTEPYGLERIDVLRGPASVLYGQNAPGGLVNRISKLPPEQALREITLGYGSNDRIQGGFDFGGPIDSEGQFLYRLTGFLRDGDNPQYKSMPDDRVYIAPALTWRPTGDTSITLLGEYLRDESGYGWFYTPPGQRPTRLWLNEPHFDDFDQTQYQIGYRAEHRFDDVWTVRQNVRYGRVEVENSYVYGLTAAANGNVPRQWERFSQTLDSVVIDNQVEARFTTGPVRHTVLAGFDYQQYNWSTFGRGGNAPPININSPVYGRPVNVAGGVVSQNAAQHLNQYGVYLQEQARLGERWVLTAGLRYDWVDGRTTNRPTAARRLSTVSELDDGALTGRIGLTYLSPTGLAPYASYTTSFQPQLGTTAPSRGATPYEPTTGKQYEVGVKYQPPGMNSFVTLAAFHLVQQNVLTTDLETPGYSVQTGEIRARGFELEGVASLADGLNLIGSLTYQDVEVTRSNTNTLNNVPLLVPRQLASVWADYTIQDGPFRGLGLGAGVRYQGHTYADNTNSRINPNSVLFDAMVRYDFLEKYRLQVNATNLADRDTYACQNNACYWGAGRTVLATLRYRW